MERDKNLDREWIKRRIKVVLEHYGVFDALTEIGVELQDRDTSMQIKCPWHGADDNPSARYYSGPDSRFHCFTCKLHLNGIDILAKSRGIEFMRALSELEHRFNIKVPRQPKIDIGLPTDKNSSYMSEAWADVPRVLTMFELKLIRIRDRVALSDYIKWCRVIDAVRWDLDHNGSQTPDMVSALIKLKDIIDRTVQDHANI